MGNGLEEAELLTHWGDIALRYTSTVTVNALRR